MTILKKLFDFYIQSSIHVGIAVCCLVKITNFSLPPAHIQGNSVMVFLGTVLGYNFLKYYKVFSKENFHTFKYYGIFAISFLSGFGFLFYLWLLKSIQIPMLISGIFVVVYPFLRKHGWLKLFFVSFVVSYITVYIPFFLHKSILLDYYITLVQRFFILSSLMIPFEIMDTKTDDQTMNTLPQLLGIQKAKLLGYVFIVVFLLLEFINFSIHNFLINAIIAIVTVVFIRFTSLERDEYYTSFWVESVPIFWWILILIFR